jgi:Cd2+/Zn2+-exporting ATPase
LDCADCARNLERALRATPGILAAEVHFATARAKLTVGAPEALDAARRAARELGFVLLGDDAAEQADAGRDRLRWTLAGLSLTLLGWLAHPPLPELASQGLLLAAVLAAGGHIFAGAYGALKRRMLTVDVLVTLAVWSAVLIGEGLAAAQVVVLMSFGEWLEERTVARTRRAVRDLLDLAPRTVTVLSDGIERVVDRDLVRIGDLLLVRPGARVPVDGRVIAGLADVSEAAITGESRLVAKSPGDQVFAGSLSADGALTIRAELVGPDTTLARIGAMIEEAQSRQAPVQRLVDRVAGVFIPITLAAAATVYFVTGEAVRAVTILIGACPCALVLATPVAVFAAIGGASRRGVLVKGGLYLERLGTIRAIAFDKTGTLTSGRQEVQEVTGYGLAPQAVLALAASTEAGSEHPVAKAILAAAAGLSLATPEDESFRAFPGQGVVARVNGETIRAGSVRWLTEAGVAIPADLADAAAAATAKGFSIVVVSRDGEALGLITLSDAIRPDAAPALAELRALGVRTLLLSGDAEGAAARVATSLGMTEYRGGMLPGDKVQVIADRVAAGESLAMVGDGINDAPALAAATVGIALGRTGTELAIEAADVVLLSDDLRRVADAVRLGRRALANIRINLALSAVAIAGLFMGASMGFVGPVAGALVHEGSALLVTLNAMRLLGGRKIAHGPHDRAPARPHAHDHECGHAHGHADAHAHDHECGHAHGHADAHAHDHECGHAHGHERHDAKAPAR